MARAKFRVPSDLVEPNSIRQWITAEVKGFKQDMAKRASNHLEIIITAILVAVVLGGMAALLFGVSQHP